MKVRAAAYYPSFPYKIFPKTFLRNQEQETKNITKSTPNCDKIRSIKTLANHTMSHSFEDLLNEQYEKPKSILKAHKPVQNEPEDITSDLKDLNLESELLRQYQKAQNMLEEGKGEPLNQRAQALNAVTGILQAIIKSQQELYNIERLKTLENTLVKVLQGFPEIKHQFLAEYEKELKKL